MMKICILIFYLLGFSNYTWAQNTAAVLYTQKYFDQKTMDVSTQDKGYDYLQALVNEKPSTTNHKNVVALALLLLKTDPSQYAAEVVLPYYLKSKTEIQSVLGTLKKEDAVHFEAAIKNHQRMLEKGSP